MPDILLIIWHDLGRHLSCYDAGSVRTPHLDRMAAEGVLLENHYSTGCVCVPSRSSILTGRYPHATGVWRFAANETALPRYLRDHGYRTVRFGFREEGEFTPPAPDFDRAAYAREVLGYQETRAYLRDAHELAQDVIDHLEADRDGAPLYACVQFSDIHRPNEAEVDQATLAKTAIPRCLPTLPATPESIKDIASFEARAANADAAVGRILNHLRASGRSEKTVVLFTTDHGLDLPRAKLTLYDAGVHVAMLAWGAGIARGQRDAGLHSHVDVFPTIAALAGLPPPPSAQGESFAGVLQGMPEAGREWVLSEKSWESPGRPGWALRTHRWAYIRHGNPGLNMMIPPDYMRKVGEAATTPLYGAPLPREELYDLAEDPCELCNLAPRAEYAAELSARAARLDSVLLLQ